MGEQETADLDWLYRRDPATVAKDRAKAERAGRPYAIPVIPVAREQRPRQAGVSPLAPAAAPAAQPRPRIAPAPVSAPARPTPAGATRPRPVPADAPVRHPLPPRENSREQTAVPPPQMPPRRPTRSTRAPRPRRRRRPLRTALVLLLLLLLVGGAYLGGVGLMAWSSIERVDDSPAGRRPATHPGTAILLVGSDARSDLTDKEKWELAIGDNGEDDVARTDSIMLLYKPPSGRSVLISVPRDSWVPIPGHGEGKVNAAFALGGPELLVQTLEQKTGFRIDGYAEVGMGGLARVVQAMDGVDLCVTARVPAENEHPEIPAGCQRLDAVKAMWFVRARHDDAQGDIGRVARQRQFLSAVIKQSLRPSVLLNPGTYRRTTDAISRGVALGKDTGMGDALALALGMQNVSSGKGYSMVMPIENQDGWSSDGQSIVILDDDRVAGLFGQLAKGDTSNVEKYAG